DDQATPTPTPIYLNRLARPGSLRREEQIAHSRALRATAESNAQARAQAKANRRSTATTRAEAKEAARAREQAQRQVAAEKRSEGSLAFYPLAGRFENGNGQRWKARSRPLRRTCYGFATLRMTKSL